MGGAPVMRKFSAPKAQSKAPPARSDKIPQAILFTVESCLGDSLVSIMARSRRISYFGKVVNR